MLPLQLRVRSSVHHGGQLRRAARPQRRAHRNRRRRCRCFGRSARLAASSVASRLLGRQRGQPHLAAHPRPRAHRHRRRCRCSSRSLCRAASSVATPLLVTVGSFFVLLILGDVLLASPPTLSRRRRSSRRAASLPEAPDSCIVLRSPSAACIDIIIAAAAVETADALCVPLPLQLPLRSLHRYRGHLHRAAHPRRRASAIIAAAVKRAASRCLALPLRLPLRFLGRGDGQLHRAAHPQRRAYRNRRHRCRRRPFFVSRGLFSCLSASRLATVDGCIVLLILSGVLLAIAAAAVEAPATLRVALPLQPSILVRLVTVGSCIALLIIDGVLITIAAARRFLCHTASSAASLLPGSSRWAVAACCSGSAAGSSPPRRPSMLRPLIVSRRLFGYLHAPWLVMVGSCIALPTLGGVLIAIATAAVDTAAALRVSLPPQPPLRSVARQTRWAVALCCSPSVTCSSPLAPPLSRRPQLFVPCCLFGCLSAPLRSSRWAAAACCSPYVACSLPSPPPLSIRRPPCVSRCLFSYLYAPWLVTVYSRRCRGCGHSWCRAASSAAALSSSRHGGQLQPAAHPQRRAHRRRR